jgi:hypothetical protein
VAAADQGSTLEARFNLPKRGRSRVRYAGAVKPKQEAELFKAALRAGIRYAEGRGAVEFEPTDSASDKALYVYRLLVHDKIITPMPEQVGFVVCKSAAGAPAIKLTSESALPSDSSTVSVPLFISHGA